MFSLGSKKVKGSPVDIGLKMDCLVDKEGLKEGIRLTVDLEMASCEQKNLIRGRVVATSTPRFTSHLTFEFLKLPAS